MWTGNAQVDLIAPAATTGLQSTTNRLRRTCASFSLAPPRCAIPYMTAAHGCASVRVQHCRHRRHRPREPVQTRTAWPHLLVHTPVQLPEPPTISTCAAMVQTKCSTSTLQQVKRWTSGRYRTILTASTKHDGGEPAQAQPACDAQMIVTTPVSTFRSSIHSSIHSSIFDRPNCVHVLQHLDQHGGTN